MKRFHWRGAQVAGDKEDSLGGNSAGGWGRGEEEEMDRGDLRFLLKQDELSYTCWSKKG